MAKEPLRMMLHPHGLCLVEDDHFWSKVIAALECGCGEKLGERASFIGAFSRHH